jgi:PAS domain S-box-containing protein
MIAVTQDHTDEIRSLEGCLTDLVSVVALPALWTGRDPSRLLTTWLERLVSIFMLEFAYVRLAEPIDEAPTELLRTSRHAEATVDVRQISRALGPWLSSHARLSTHTLPNPVGDGQVQVAFLRMGMREELGVLVTAMRRPGFPTQTEVALLQVAVSQAVIGLHEARRSAEREQAEQNLEQRVAERTGQLVAVNAELRHQIAERERTEQERLELASLVENSSDFIGIASLAGNTLFLNPAGQHMLGIEGDLEARGRELSDFVVERDRRQLYDCILPIVKQKGCWDGELCFRHSRTGAELPMLAHVFLIKEPESGKPVALATISRDITQRKRAEAELLALKDELAAELTAMTRLHEFSTRLLASTDLQPLLTEVLSATMSLQNADFGSVQLYNPVTRALDMLVQRGFRQECLEYFKNPCPDAPSSRSLGLGMRVVIEDVEQDLHLATYQAFAAAAGFRAEQSTPLFSRSGARLGVISTYFRRPHQPSERDLRLTDLYARQASEMIERERTEAALRRSEFYLAKGQKISQTGSWVWNLNSGEVFWSHENFRILGLDPRTTRPSYELFWGAIHPEDWLVRQRFEKAVLSGRDFEEQFRLFRADGTLRYIHSVAHPVFNDAGELTEYIGTVVDTTARKLAEEALRRAEHELAHVSRVMTMGELTASIAHEVNQPLAAVVTSANACVRWLAAAPANVHEADAAARRIARDAQRASDVIGRIRALLTRHEPEKIEVCVADIIREVVSLVQGEARARGVMINCPPPSDLPAVLGDRVQLQQVILNLAMNGIEAMRSITSRARVLDILAERHAQNQVCIKVSDTGPGLEPQHRDRIFDAFYTTKAQGMGMGLAICRSIVDAHGGRLWAVPNPGDGETFQFTLPIADAD